MMPYHPNFFSSSCPVYSFLPPQIMAIADQLFAYTGKSFAIDFSREHDVSFANRLTKRITISECYLYPTHSPSHKDPLSSEALVGILAHEWGHLVDKTLFLGMPASRQTEYNADVFAAQFLASHGYPIEPYIDHCIDRPEFPGDVHGSHIERATILRDVYSRSLSAKATVNFAIDTTVLDEFSYSRAI